MPINLFSALAQDYFAIAKSIQAEPAMLHQHWLLIFGQYCVSKTLRQYQLRNGITLPDQCQCFADIGETLVQLANIVNVCQPSNTELGKIAEVMSMSFEYSQNQSNVGVTLRQKFMFSVFVVVKNQGIANNMYTHAYFVTQLTLHYKNVPRIIQYDTFHTCNNN